MSDFEKISDAIINSGKDNGIQCIFVNNSSCIKCDKVNRQMIRVGAFIMCENCWMKEFGVNVIPIESRLYTETYSKWLKKYQSQ